jgi:FkbM family methyltransferase
MDDTAGHNILVETRHGPMLCNRHDIYIGRSLIEYGEYGQDEADLLCQVAQPGHTVVEVGANIGSLSVPLAQRIGPAGRLIAFEPQRLVFQTLCANLALSSLTNAEAHWAGLSDTAGELTVPDLPPDQAFNFGGVALGAAAPGTGPGPGNVRVPIRRLDDLALAHCHLVKIDVEGMEAAVLRGAVDTIMRCRPVIYTENDRAERAPDLIRLLQSFGYRLYWHVAPLYRRDNFRDNPHDVFGSVVSLNMLCTPPGRGIHVEGLREVRGPYDRPG